MKRYMGVGLALGLAGLLAGAPNFSSAQTGGAPWPTFHANAQRTGATGNAGPAGNQVANQWSIPHNIANASTAIESSPAIDAAGTGYVGSDNGVFYAFNTSDPRLPIWSFKTGGPILSSPTLSADGKAVFFGSNDGFLYGVNTATGKQIWSVEITAEVHASPTLSADGATIFITNNNGNIRAVRTADGTTVWGPINLGTTIPGSLTLSPDGNTLYIAGYSGFLFAIPATGANAGKSITTKFYLSGHAASTPVVDGNGNIYVTTSDGYLQSFTPGSPTERWSFSTPGHQASSSTPAIGNGIVIFGDTDGAIYDVSPTNGQPVWNAFPHTLGPIGSSPAISSNNVVYVGSNDGQVYAFSSQTGTRIWSKNVAAAVTSSPAIGPDGSMWVGSQGGVLYRFALVDTPPGTPKPGSTAVPTTSATSGPTSAVTTTATATGNAPVIKLQKLKVKPGKKQSVRVTTTPNTVVRIRVDYPNGQHQSKRATSNAAGVVTYSYKQGASKIKHNNFFATVTAKAGDPPNQGVATATYRILFSKIDVSVEPPLQSVGKTINIYVHSSRKRALTVTIKFPKKIVTLNGHAGKNGFMHKRYKIPKSVVGKGTHKVKAFANTRSGSSASTSMVFKVKKP